jgi:hypothetical protein
MPAYDSNLAPVLLEAKLNYIFLRWGVDKTALDQIVSSDALTGLGRNPRTKFKRYLNSLEQAFNHISKSVNIRDRLKTDPFLEEYHQEVRRQLGDEARFLKYLTGEWDNYTVRAVSIAQKKHMVAQRVKTMSQQQPRVAFQPPSAYRDYLNK